MAGIYYAVVEGDPLDNGNGWVLTGSKYCLIDDDKGRPRRQTHLGQLAYCGICNSNGPIVAGAGIRQSLRGYDERLRAFEAVGGDIVACKCEHHPRILSTYARTCMYLDEAEGIAAPDSRACSQEARSVIFGEQFTLCDATGKPMPETFYTVGFPSGESLHGVTDSFGRTERHTTSSAQIIRVYLGHRDAS